LAPATVLDLDLSFSAADDRLATSRPPREVRHFELTLFADRKAFGVDRSTCAEIDLHFSEGWLAAVGGLWLVRAPEVRLLPTGAAAVLRE